MTSTAGERSASAPGVRSPAILRAWLVWVAAALFYLLAYFLRVSPAVMTADLMRAFRIGGAGLGTLSATYFYAYVAMQIPVGILVDGWGARRLLVLGTILTGVGSFVFGGTGSMTLACLARALIGGATAVAWISTLKLITHWFPARRFALLSGLSLMIGNLGALVAQIPLRLLVQRFAWRPVTLASGVVALALAGLVLLWVRNDPEDIGRPSYAPPALREHAPASWGGQIRGIGQLFHYRNTWLIFFAQGGLLGPVLTFAGLWGPAYLASRYHMPGTRAAGVDSVMLLAFAVASPLMGFLSDYFGGRKPIYVVSAVAAAASWSAMFLLPGLSAAGFVALAALASFAASSCILGFAFGKESVPEKHLGTISGLMNMGNILGPMLLQPAVGWLLDLHWSGVLQAGARVYSPGAFRFAFGLMLAWPLLSIVCLALTRETHCRQAA